MTEKEINLKLVIVLGRLMKSMEQALAPRIIKAGITITQFGVLESLYYKGPLAVNEIIRITLSSSGNMGVVISNIEKAPEGKVPPCRGTGGSHCTRRHFTLDLS